MINLRNIIDENLTWHHQINNVANLNRANAMLSKIWHFAETLISIYHATFESHLNYSLSVWAQYASSIKRLLVLQKKSLKIIHFLRRNEPKLLKVGSLLQRLHIHIIPDGLTQVALKYLVIIRNYMEDIQSI